MALPKANYPVYNITIPSTGKEIKYRPFLVKEQKIILQSIEFKDANNFVNSILNIVDSCTFSAVDVTKLSMYDIDYLFLHIRAKSIGEFVPVSYKCLAVIENIDEDTGEYSNEICNNTIPISLNLTEVKVVTPPEFEAKRLIMIDENLGMKLRVPNFENFKRLDKIDNVGKMFSVTERFIFDCVENIFDENGIMIPTVDFTVADFIEFLENLPTGAVQNINEFFRNMPHISLDVRVACTKCGAVDDIELRTLDDFFV